MPFSEDLFVSLGYEKADSGKMKHTKDNFNVLKAILSDIKAYQEKYEQIPEETLNYMAQAEEEEKKRKGQIEKLGKQAELDRMDKKKDFVAPPLMAKELKFGATEVVFKPPCPARK